MRRSVSHRYDKAVLQFGGWPDSLCVNRSEKWRYSQSPAAPALCALPEALLKPCSYLENAAAMLALPTFVKGFGGSEA